MDQVYMYTQVCIGVCLHAASLYVCACVVVGVYAWIKFICIRKCL